MFLYGFYYCWISFPVATGYGAKVLCSSIFVSGRARFGLLYLNDGSFNHEQILPAGWVKQSVIPSSAAEEGEYGFQWWLNAGEKSNPENRWFPSLPADMFFADGFEGQNVFIIPSKKLAVVRLGLTRKGQYGEGEFLERVIKSIN